VYAVAARLASATADGPLPLRRQRRRSEDALAARVGRSYALTVARPPSAPAAPEGQIGFAVHIQQLMHERSMFAPIVEPPFLSGVGPRLDALPTIGGRP